MLRVAGRVAMHGTGCGEHGVGSRGSQLLGDGAAEHFRRLA
jgi:hypothetical protein